jgi:hypothetical protein
VPARLARYLIAQQPVDELDVLTQAGGAFGWVPVGNARHRVVGRCSAGADAQLQPPFRDAVDRDSLLRQDRRVVQRDVRDQDPQAYPLGTRP